MKCQQKDLMSEYDDSDHSLKPPMLAWLSVR